MIRYLVFFLPFALLISLMNPLSAQNANTDDEMQVIQFSGVVMTSDSLAGLPFATVINLTGRKGTISNHQGFFSFVAAPGDSILFSHVGMKDAYYRIPVELEDNKYSVIQLMTPDTVYLPQTIIYPWPSKADFKYAFLNLDIPDDDLERAKKNLEREMLKEIGESMAMDGNENQDYYLRQEAAKFYYNGQVPPMNILNPLAWAKFIQAWKNGDFKRDK